MARTEKKPGIFKQIIQAITLTTEATNKALDSVNSSLDELNHSLDIKNTATRIYSQRCNTLTEEWATLKVRHEHMELCLKNAENFDERKHYEEQLNTLTKQLNRINLKKDILKNECDLEAIEHLKDNKSPIG